MTLVQDPESKLLLPREFVDEKQSLINVINELVDSTVLSSQHVKENYYLTLHAKFDEIDSTQFNISQPVITYRLPPFSTNQFVFWVSNQKGICELLWMVSRDNSGKPKVEFNKSGVAYLQAKGAMPK